MMTVVAEDGKKREMTCLPLDMLNGWLFGIDANRVKPEIKDKVIAYQRECFKVLADHFGIGTTHHYYQADICALSQGIEQWVKLARANGQYLDRDEIERMVYFSAGIEDEIDIEQHQMLKAMQIVGDALQGYLMPKAHPAISQHAALPRLNKQEGFTYQQTQDAVRALKVELARDWPEAHDVVDSVGRMLSHYFTIVQETRHQLFNIENQVHKLAYCCRTDMKERFSH